jgi:3-phosphoshikimate 1-carboxyvinyltransferase
MSEAGFQHAPHAPAGVAGTICVPSSKSLTQRALLAAALAGAGASVRRPLEAEDPRLLYGALRAVGFGLDWRDDVVTVGAEAPRTAAHVLMGNNGTGVRLLLALLAARPGVWQVDGGARLRERPIAPLVAALRALGAEIEPFGTATTPTRLPLVVRGRALRGGVVELDASVSSQFVSALLLLGCQLPEGLTVLLPAPPPSRPYLDLTIDVMAAFGASVAVAGSGTRFVVPPARLQPIAYEVEGDWSAAAFPLAAVAIAGGEVEVEGVRLGSRQGDAAVLEVLTNAGCVARASRRGVIVHGPTRRPIAADLRDTPDMFPALSVVAAVAGGRLSGLAGLAAKESDRLATMTAHLRALGFAVAAGVDWFDAPGGVPTGLPALVPLDPAADHRVAMALAVAGCVVANVVIADPECVGKSWPGFWKQWPTLIAGR